MNTRIQWIVISVLVVLTMYSQLRIMQFSNQVHDIVSLPAGLTHIAAQSVESVEGAKQQAVHFLQDSLSAHLVSTAKAITNEQSRAMTDRLEQLAAQINKGRVELAALEEQQKRVRMALPEPVELDDLDRHYANAWVEDFKTAQGPISFTKTAFTFARIPSSNKLAWMKIGREKSTENSELIKAWLNESAAAKGHLGYTRQYSTTKPTDYGEFTEALYRKGDMYFRTYYQYSRVQGTYARHSLEYTYYVEIGSETRKRQYELEQYNQKLGS